MTMEITRKRFVQGPAALGGGLALGGSLSALAARTAGAQARPRAHGYGPLRPTPELDSGKALLALPKGSSTGWPRSPAPATRSSTSATTRTARDEGEIPVEVPSGKRHDPDPAVRGGSTKVVVSAAGEVLESYAVLAGTHTNYAGGRTPWGTWITCEEILNSVGARGRAGRRSPSYRPGPWATRTSPKRWSCATSCSSRAARCC